MIRLRIVAVVLTQIISISIARATDTYVLNGDFSQGREHWDEDGIIVTDPDDKQNPVLKIKLERYAHGISQHLSVPASTDALVGGLRARLINPRTKLARVLVQAWLRLKGKEDSLLIAEQYLDKQGWVRIIIPPV